MVDLVVPPIRKISEKQRRNVSRNSMYKRLGMSRRERILARKKNLVHSSGSSEETSADLNEGTLVIFYLKKHFSLQ